VLVFIDESGDSGFRFDKGSSELFVCAAVIFTENLKADDCDRAIDEVRARLGKPVGWEFHFSKCSHDARKAFFGAVIGTGFTYHAFVVNKRHLYSGTFKDKSTFYNFAVGIVCENAKALFADAKVVIDECGNNEFRKRLARSLKASVKDGKGDSLIAKVVMEKSHSNNLVQLADMVCGAVARVYSNKIDGGEYRNMIKKREGRVQFWPK